MPTELERLEALSEGATEVRRKFFARASIGGSDACWLWQGAKTGAGYGALYIDRHTILAHRVSYSMAKGHLPPQVHHRCGVRHCVNPHHLLGVTQYEHGQEHRPTHCKRGHEFTPENTYMKPPGWQICLTCKRENDRRRLARKRAQ